MRAGKKRGGVGIACLRRGAGLDPKRAGLAHHAPRLGVIADRIAPVDAAALHIASQDETLLRVENGDRARHKAQGRVVIRGDHVGGDGGAGQGHGSREILSTAKLDVPVEAQVFEIRMVPMRAAAATDSQGQAAREARMGERPANEGVARAEQGGRHCHLWAVTTILYPNSRNTPEELAPLALNDRELTFACSSGLESRLALIRSGDTSVIADMDLGALGGLTKVLGGCARYTGKTSPCVCDWTPMRTAEQVPV